MKIFIPVAAVLLLLSCAPPPGSSSRPESSSSSAAETAAQSRQLVRSVSMSVESSDSNALAKEAEVLAASHGGYVESLEARQGQDGTHYKLVLRVSAGQLEAVVETLKSEASEVVTESWSTEDVTSQVVDMDAHTRALRLTEQQLEALLAESRTAGRDAEGIMAIFRELTSVREEREKVQGRLAAVKELVSLSRITVSIAPAELVFSLRSPGALARRCRTPFSSFS
jgi:Domain of unknown function (DUF4349)